MHRNERGSVPSRARSAEGVFTHGINNGEGYRTCNILGAEIRVWGAEGTRGLSREVTSALRAIVKRVEPSRPIALMPDYHPAEFGVVGSVVVTDERVVPDIIGGDCGCGVRAVRTGYAAEQFGRALLTEVYREIRRAIPLGTAQNAEVTAEVQALDIWQELRATPFVGSGELRKLRHQLGSLGGGNHFVELAVGCDGAVWVVVHSGSRYLGGLLRAHYQGRNLTGDEALQFLSEQANVLAFARASRREMAERVLKSIAKFPLEARELGAAIDLPHNFVAFEAHQGVVLAVHRKGACAAEDGQPGVIPGSMASGSYVVEGRGSLASYSSSSHGAGRILSRGEAFRAIRMREFEREMEGIVWSGSDKLRDEAPAAYKELDSVMRAQRDLVRARHRLFPILSIKGEG